MRASSRRLPTSELKRIHLPPATDDGHECAYSFLVASSREICVATPPDAATCHNVPSRANVMRSSSPHARPRSQSTECASVDTSLFASEIFLSVRSPTMNATVLPSGEKTHDHTV